ncbi:MAG: hypothetical protein M3Q08_00135 [Pseudomonadota bacterium]|nr:hypothetical protein [Pseudomonadota bacterium]
MTFLGVLGLQTRIFAAEIGGATEALLPKCGAARAAGTAPLYQPELDSDDDAIAYESDRW